MYISAFFSVFSLLLFWLSQTVPDRWSKATWVRRRFVQEFIQIEKARDDDYKFVLCPREGNCFDVGIFVDEKGVRHLALSYFLVMFRKAHVTDGSTFKAISM
ncbi:hypothetical protein DY000_02045240 [Brassica cretica]|uniref:Secreted protein n=1 Tax=Brassica cretica TaxID=69181 RepID=A0ABQ7F7W4_BRACR|nr:hypothetical protein DY000_02045240 [Brassica cretica]